MKKLLTAFLLTMLYSCAFAYDIPAFESVGALLKASNFEEKGKNNSDFFRNGLVIGYIRGFQEGLLVAAIAESNPEANYVIKRGKNTNKSMLPAVDMLALLKSYIVKQKSVLNEPPGLYVTLAMVDTNYIKLTPKKLTHPAVKH